MVFDKTTVIAGVKLALSATDKSRGPDIELAMGLCLDDLSTRLVSKGFLMAYDEPLTLNVRDQVLKGLNEDLKYLFGIKYNYGAEIIWLDYCGVELFLRKYDIADDLQGPPTLWTQLTADGGYPVIKLDRNPADNSFLTVYYYPEYTPDNVQNARSIATITSGTLSYFYGIGTPAGAPYYAAFNAGSTRMRASDDFRSKPTSVIVPSKDDEAIRSARDVLKGKRM